ncbi:DUF6461 domain-containing protein [Nonomuraea sp. NPDC047529]|uniref:DUF6461 domain-containing protein n=1 Tax=Nonomuraea sp. NPDC047529 TaxID=3155623 RepID=UPI0033C806AD
MEIPRVDFSWIASGWELGDIWCLTFVRGLDEAEALRRMGVAEESIRPLTYRELADEGLFPHTVLAGRLEGWVVLIERNGSQATEPDTIRALSAKTELISVLRHDYATDLFVYAIDGDRLTSFDPRKPAWRYGSDPDRLLDAMEAVGIHPNHLSGVHATPETDDEWDTGPQAPTMSEALMLAARITGVLMSQEVLNAVLLSGVIAHEAEAPSGEAAGQREATSLRTSDLFAAIRQADL